ncbi:hypothetical protein GCM10009665_29080 [Kitasatospora nipponensis]|uniref:Uncharacterized protein n=1 Tax=Kitasatospora nipponensis TaxID=258049 RepID=A0ABP4GSZ0_9ACTN
MRDHVHRVLGAHRVGDREQVGGQQLQPVLVAGTGHAGLARPAHVVADHVVVQGQVLGHVVPDPVGVRIAVHQQDGGVLRVALLEDREVDTGRVHGPAADGGGGHAAASSRLAQRRTCGRSSSSQ